MGKHVATHLSDLVTSLCACVNKDIFNNTCLNKETLEDLDVIIDTWGTIITAQALKRLKSIGAIPKYIFIAYIEHVEEIYYQDR